MLAVVTGFFIPTATPPAGETDGPLGALFLARALVPLGIPVVLATDDFCVRAVEAGLAECGLRKQVPIVTLPTPQQTDAMTDAEYRQYFDDRNGSDRADAFAGDRARRPEPTAATACHTMRGRDITDLMSPAHRLFLPSPHRGRVVGGEGDEVPDGAAPSPLTPLPQWGEGNLVTIGIGDGGNEIGMGKIPWDVIERNIPNGGTVACRIATQHLIVTRRQQLGAYALAAGVTLLRGKPLDATLFDVVREREILQAMVDAGPLVDGVRGTPSATVDGLTWDQYAAVLTRIGAVGNNGNGSKPG